jgi:6-phosphogluconolactonase
MGNTGPESPVPPETSGGGGAGLRPAGAAADQGRATEVELRVHEDPARVAADELVRAARAGGHIALAGGSTPRRAYELAAAAERDWSRAHAWWGDERCVPPDDERSNYRLAREALLDRLGTPPTVHRVQSELEPEAAAAAYDAELEHVTLDLVLLGLGPDGHTASLFPDAPSLDERQRRALAAEPGLEPRVARVTMTIPVFESASLVVFLVTGADKAAAAERAFAGTPDRATPASLIRSLTGRTVALLDAAAAVRLTK